MEIPKNLKYTKSHEWLRIENREKARLGITEYAQSKLMDIVYVELPEVGKKIAKNEPLGSLESVKAISDFYAPCSGEVIEVNKKLEGSPELLNKDPYGEGWLVVLKLTKPEELDLLLTPEQYEEELKKEP